MFYPRSMGKRFGLELLIELMSGVFEKTLEWRVYNYYEYLRLKTVNPRLDKLRVCRYTFLYYVQFQRLEPISLLYKSNDGV